MEDPSKYAIIWDVDGTLVDTAGLHFDSWVALAKEIDRPFTRADFQRTFGQRNPEILRLLFDPHYSDEKVASLGDRKEELYRAAARQGVELLPGADAAGGVAASGVSPGGSARRRGKRRPDLRADRHHGYFGAVRVDGGHPARQDRSGGVLTAASKLAIPRPLW